MVHVQAYVALRASFAMIRAELPYYIYRLLGSVAPFVPRRLGYWLAVKIGYALYFLNPSGSAVLRENLSHAMGPEAEGATLRATAIKAYGNLAKNYFDLFYNHSISEEEAGALVSVRGVHHGAAALKKGRGLVLTSAHFGALEAAWQVGPLLDLTITAPAEHLKPEKLYRYTCRLRASSWMSLIPIDGPLLSLFRALRRGHAVAVAADRDITSSGIMVDFFGAPARLPDGHVQLALRTGAPLLPVFALRDADNRPIVQVEPPIELEYTGNFEQDVRVNVRKVVSRMEDWIRRYPEQWPMLHRVWLDGNHGS
jgi:lauroyl/myristoyl acyltransferase